MLPQPEYGFTSVRKVPGTKDAFIALKVKERGDVTDTLLTVFGLDGRFLLDARPGQVPGSDVAGADAGAWIRVGTDKFEGLDFLSLNFPTEIGDHSSQEDRVYHPTAARLVWP